MTKLLVALLSVGMLVGCSEMTMYDNGKCVENCEEEIKEETVKEEKPKEEPKEVVVEEPDVTLEEYANNMSFFLSEFSFMMTDFSDLMLEGTDPNVLVSVAYQDRVQAISDDMIRLIYDIENTEVPIEARHIHDKTLQAMAEYRFMAENLPQAIREVDSDKIYLLTESMYLGNEYLGEATQLVLELAQ